MKCVESCLSQINISEKKLHNTTKPTRGRPKKIHTFPNTSTIKLDENIINNTDAKTSNADIEILTGNQELSNTYNNDNANFPDFLIDHVYDNTKTYYPSQNYF